MMVVVVLQRETASARVDTCFIADLLMMVGKYQTKPPLPFTVGSEGCRALQLCLSGTHILGAVLRVLSCGEQEDDHQEKEYPPISSPRCRRGRHSGGRR